MSNLGQQVVETYRAWDDLARRHSPAGTPPEEDPNRIIDIDILPQGKRNKWFDDGPQVQAGMENLLEQVQAPRDDVPNGDFIARKLAASLLHLRVLAGDKVVFKDHVRGTMGLEAEPVDESEMDDQRTRLDDTLKRHGLGFDRQSYGDFVERLAISDADQLAGKLAGAARWAGRFIDISTGEKPLVTEPEVVKAPKPWVGWFGTAEGQPFLKLNAHPQHAFNEGRIGAVVLHEMGHGTHFGIWQRAILGGDMSPAMGVTTLHGPENVQAEAYAQLVEQLGLRATRGEEAWQYHWQAEYHDYISKVWHNAHIRINTGHAEEMVVGYAGDRLPYTPEELIRLIVADNRDDPTLRAYMASYEPGLAAVRPVYDMPPARQREVLRQLGSQPLTLEGIQGVVQGQVQGH